MSTEDPQYGQGSTPPTEASKAQRASELPAKVRKQTRAPRDRALTHARHDR